MDNMKKMLGISSVIIAGVVGASAADVDVGVDFASAYVFRGATLNDGFVAQPYLEASGIGGFTIGTWSNFDLDDNAGGSPEGGNFSEVDYYLSYDLPIESDAVGVSVGYCEYMYPRAGGSATVSADGTSADVTPVDADRELSLGLSFDAPLSPEVGIYYGIDGGIDKALYIELGLGHEVELGEGVTGSIGGTLGFLDPDSGDSGISFAGISLGVSYGFLSAGVQYIIETDKDVLSVDEDFVGTIGISGSF